MIDIDDFYMIPCMIDMSDEWNYLLLYRSAAGLLSKYWKFVLWEVSGAYYCCRAAGIKTVALPRYLVAMCMTSCKRPLIMDRSNAFVINQEIL